MDMQPLLADGALRALEALLRAASNACDAERLEALVSAPGVAAALEAALRTTTAPQAAGWPGKADATRHLAVEAMISAVLFPDNTPAGARALVAQCPGLAAALRGALPGLIPLMSLAGMGPLKALEAAASALEKEKRAATLTRQQQEEARGGSSGASGSGTQSGGGGAKQKQAACAACGVRAGGAGVKLRACTGCNAVVYCGAAW